MGVYEKALITILVVNAVLIAVCIPLALRRVPRNFVYGFRTRTTLSDDKVWYDVNAYFAVRLIVASAIAALGFLFLYIAGPFSPQKFLIASILFMVVPSLAATIMTLRFISRQ